MNKCTILFLVAIACQVLLVHAQYETFLLASLLGGQGSGGSGGPGMPDLFGGSGSSSPSSNMLSLRSLPGLQSVGSSSSTGSSSTGNADQMMSALGLPSLGSQALAGLGRRSSRASMGSLLSSIPGLGSAGGMNLAVMSGLMGAPRANTLALADSIDKDLTALNVLSDLGFIPPACFVKPMT